MKIYGALIFLLLSFSASPAADELQTSIEKKAAILRALAAGEQWDAFLLAEREFERYEDAYPDLSKLRIEALRGSLDQHRRDGEKYFAEQAYGPAWRELTEASARQPSDAALAERARAAWAEYSREVAEQRKGSRKPLDTAGRDALDRALRMAVGYRQAQQLADAQKSLLRAESLDPESLDLLLEKTKLLGAVGEFGHALATLDRYDLRAVGEERAAGAALRTELLAQRAARLRNLEAEAAKAWDEGRYYRVRALAIAALRTGNDDASLLSYAGRASMIVRMALDARGFFAKYMEASNTLDGDPSERANVRAWMASVETRPAPNPAPESGDRNWFSGKRLVPGIAYCPISLAFQAKIDRIEEAGGRQTKFEWRGERLLEIDGREKIAFLYQDVTPAVFSVAAGGHELAKLPADPDEAYRQTSVVLLNSPLVDPLAVRRLTGRNVAVTVAGNLFFEPFVWDGVHYFSIEYDDAGRIAHAVEIDGPRGKPVGGTALEFEWDGPRLVAILGHQGARKTYRRTLQYADGRLVGEAIEAEGGVSNIRYRYDKGRLVSAACDADSSLGAGPRQVTFR